MTDRQASRTPSRLAKAVRIERDRKGWTSEKLADAAGVSHSWVRNFEAGIIQNPGADRLRALEEALDLRTGELYAASLSIPYDKLVAELLAGQDGRKAPWDEMLAGIERVLSQLTKSDKALYDGQRMIAKELRALAKRLSPSDSVNEDAVVELVESAVEQGIRQGRERATLPPEASEAS